MRPEWRLMQRDTNNNGLTVLERSSSPSRIAWNGPVQVADVGVSSRACPGLTSQQHAWVDGRLQRWFASAWKKLWLPTAWAHVRLAVALLAFGSETKASPSNASGPVLHHLSAALRLDPQQPHALLGRACQICPDWNWLSCSDADLNHVASLYRKAAEAHGSWEARLALSALSAARGDLHGARREQRLAAEIQPDSFHVRSFEKVLARSAHSRHASVSMEYTSAMIWMDDQSVEPLPFSSLYWRVQACRAAAVGSGLPATSGSERPPATSKQRAAARQTRPTQDH